MCPNLRCQRCKTDKPRGNSPKDICGKRHGLQCQTQNRRYIAFVHSTMRAYRIKAGQRINGGHAVNVTQGHPHVCHQTSAIVRWHSSPYGQKSNTRASKSGRWRWRRLCGGWREKIYYIEALIQMSMRFLGCQRKESCKAFSKRKKGW